MIFRGWDFKRKREKCFLSINYCGSVELNVIRVRPNLNKLCFAITMDTNWRMNMPNLDQCRENKLKQGLHKLFHALFASQLEDVVQSSKQYDCQLLSRTWIKIKSVKTSSFAVLPPHPPPSLLLNKFSTTCNFLRQEINEHLWCFFFQIQA